MISPYEAPLFARNGWLDDLSAKYIARDPGYDAGDLLPPVAKALSYKGDLYAAPFYGESSMLYYRKSLLARKGISMPLHPTWQQVAQYAARLNQPGKVAGICQRGLAGWGDNMAALDTVVNTFGGRWFDENWKPQLTSPAFTRAVNFYVSLTRQYGEAGASNDSFNQLLTLYGQGQCAMWYDSTVAATSIVGTYPAVAKDTGYAFAPTERTKDSGWLYSWAMGIPSGTPSQTAAWKFASWASSKSYDQLVAKQYGWSAVPPGARTSLYQNPGYQKAAGSFADITLQSLDGADPDHPTVDPVPYVGVQYVDVPQFETLGLQVGEQIAGAIAGTESVGQALATSQTYASDYTPKQLSGTNGK
jgi:sorbitol/mannitol transport system substrate-binding protein